MSSIRLTDWIMACKRKLTFSSDSEECADNSDVDPDYLPEVADQNISIEDEQVSVAWHYSYS